MAGIHPLADRGFADVADRYDRGRPDYPPAVVTALGLASGARVLDLAAGTGKLTRVLRAAGLDVVAVEPQPAMRARLPGALDGTAENLPLGDASVDAVTIGDAWHWFDHAAASAELERVVRPGGVVAILWQYPHREGMPEWATALGEILLPLRGEHPGFAAQMTAPGDHAAFAPHTEQAVGFAYETDRERYLDFVASMSYIASLPVPERDDVLARVAALLPDGPFSVPYETRIWLSRRLP
jgi:SAM-dependent methyltransferase